MTDKMTIYEVLDSMNEEVGYKGLSNDNKTTDERDDVISRQALNNWIREYNKFNTREIKPIKKNQYESLYFRTDVLKLIAWFKPRLIKEFKKKTISIEESMSEAVKGFGINPSSVVDERENKPINRIPKTLISNNPFSNVTEKDLKERIEKEKMNIINTLLNMDQVEQYAFQSLFDGSPILIEELRKDCIKKAPAD